MFEIYILVIVGFIVCFYFLYVIKQIREIYFPNFCFMAAALPRIFFFKKNSALGHNFDYQECFQTFKTLEEYKKVENQMPKIGIVSTIKNPHHLQFWINYHKKIGIDYFYLFDDDGVSIPERDDIKRYVYNADYLEKIKGCSLFLKFGPSFKEEVMSRQILNEQVAFKEAMNDGVDWLLHIDADELLYFPKDVSGEYENIRSRLIDVPEDIDWLKIYNYEVIVNNENVDNCFTDLNYFRTQKGAKLFKAYGNGKGLCRVRDDIEPAGVHEFYNNKLEKDRHQILANTIILHFCSCRFDDWKNKYKTLGDFPDHYWGNPANNKVFNFHAQSRDIRTTNDNTKMKFYKNEFMLSQKEIDILLEKGLAQQIKPTEWLLD